MNLFYKLGLVLIVVVTIYLWNRFVMPTMFRALIGFHERYNSKNLNRQPIRFVRDNKIKLIRGFAIFYWVAGALIIYGILQTD